MNGSKFNMGSNHASKHAQPSLEYSYLYRYCIWLNYGSIFVQINEQ